VVARPEKALGKAVGECDALRREPLRDCFQTSHQRARTANAHQAARERNDAIGGADAAVL
jgi:hypothetical protein